MKKYDQLKNATIDGSLVEIEIDNIFNINVKTKNDINKDIEISEDSYAILTEGIKFAKSFAKSYDYDIVLFYEKCMRPDRKFYIKFIHD